MDNIRRQLGASPVTTVTAGDWSLLYSMDEGMSELYELSADPRQQMDLIHDRPEVAKELHGLLVKFMRETGVPDGLLNPRLEIRI